MIDENKLIDTINEVISERISNGGTFPSLYAAIGIIVNQPKVGEWIPCSDMLPKDCDERFYMCVVENHEEDPPMYLQYSEYVGFGLWNNVFDAHSLGFVDSYFSTNEELGYEKVIAWRELPEPYKEGD